jgi:ribosome-associated protein
MNWPTILSELSFRTSRSSGAGGQHVNKTETKVEVLFHVESSNGLDENEKVKIASKLAARINDNGELILASQKSRSQVANKEDVIERLQKLLEKALLPVVKRKKTRPSAEAKEERLMKKKQQAEKKELRKRPEL